MQNITVRRWLAGLGVAGALVATAGPAHAVAPGAKLAMYLSDTTIAVGSNGKVESPILYSTAGTLTLRDITIRYDFSDLADVATVTDADSFGECSSPSDHELVCTLPYEWDVDEWGSTGAAAIVLAPTQKAKDGDEGDLKVSFGAAGHETVTHTAKVRIGEGVDIAAGEELTRSGAPGSKFSTPLTVSNAGETAIQGAVAIFYNDYGFRATTKFSNCTYADDDLLTCRFDEPLQPGTSYTAELPYAVGADAEAPGSEYGEIVWMTTAEFEDYTAYLNRLGSASLGKKGGHGELALTKVTGAKAQGRQADTDPENNWSSVDLKVTGKQGADLAALGATLTGEAGDVVAANVGLRNEGPATIDVRRGGGAFTNAYLTVPAGTTVVEVPENCAPRNADGTDWSEAGKAGAKAYHCWSSSFIKVGDRETYPFKLRIDEVVANATGSIAINVDCQCDGRQSDLDGSNDEAKILVNPTDGGGGGGGLPVTGASTGIVAGAGILLLAAGAFGFVLARRRRTRFVV